MSESTKALHQAASTLKKNPGRVDRLVKEAALRIVPAGRYASGKAKEMAEAAIKKLKEPKGFGGADLSTKSTKFFKEASDKSKEVNRTAALTAIGAANGGALGYVARSDMATKRIKGHDASRSFAATKAGSPIEKNLANSAKRLRRMKPTVGRLARRAGVAGALAGAALGVASGMKKEAADKTRDAALTIAGAGAGAAAGHVAAQIRGESKVLDRVSDATARDLASKRSISKSLERQGTYERRAGRLVNKAKGKARLIGAAIGAVSAVGANKLEKKAARQVVPHKGQHLMPKGAPIPAGAKDVSPKAVLKARAGKVGKAVAAVGGVAALAAAAKHRMEKKASQKDGKGHVSVGDAVAAGASAAGLRRLGKDGVKMRDGLNAQIKHIQSKGWNIRPIDVQQAVHSFKKPLARRAGKAALKGGALAAAAAAGVNKLMDSHKAKARAKFRMQKQAETVGSQGDREMKKVVNSNGKKGHMALQPGADKKPVKTATKSKNPLAKQAAELVIKDGKKYRKGTPLSAAATMAGISGGLTAGANIAAYRTAKKHALGEVISRRSILKGVPQQAAYNAAIGYAYGKIRSHFRKKRGEADTSHADFAKLKAGN